MSIHPSLKISDKDKKVRSVMKRTERMRNMMEKGLWKQGDKVFGLPKIKALRIKIKKEKIEKAETAATATEGAAPAAETKTAEQAAPKAQASRAQEKK
ncbi:MAG: small basic protein [Candidatus Omnitrophota bacterium]